MSDFATQARRALEHSGYSITAAARELSYNRAFLSRVLNKKQQPSLRLARMLDDLTESGGELYRLASDERSDSPAPDVVRALGNSSRTGGRPDAATSSCDRGARVKAVMERPSRLDKQTVAALADLLKSQRRLEDAIGPAALIESATAQLANVGSLARAARGPHRQALVAVAAEWYQYVGWLNAALRNDERAVTLLTQAEELSDEADDGVVAAVAVSFKGYVARQQGNFRRVVRQSHAALHAPGAHPTQQVYDTIQAATGYADLGDHKTARRLLAEAVHASEEAGDPPDIVYWYTPEFFRMSIGMVSLSLGDYASAAAALSQGLAGLPADQRTAEWTQEYRTALEHARQH
ncbi:hypothetical protein [Streptomyces aidingensis]|uniref:Helix-turn-helix domain-containing protein n=1 Tax=Streptomyces aidingensis TaxID=910347 RepID=A0A1I1S960_9ACTN|nr:hypothetical protein [Streptomyces aidingensis]SFD41138.1 hypothetical protein SAMN05421773_114169 [Streptomyces aidingensis]